jgi:hypothetical protein
LPRRSPRSGRRRAIVWFAATIYCTPTSD